MGRKARTEWKMIIRRKIAAFMTILMTFEAPLTAWAAVSGISGPDPENFKYWNIMDKGKPSTAFSKLTLTTGGKVGQDNTFFVGIDGVLNDEWRMERYENFLDQGGIDEELWNAYEDERNKYPDCETYDDYLDSRENDELQEISFTCSFSDQADGDNVFALSGGKSGDIMAEGVRLGTYTIEKDKAGNRAVLRGTFLRSVYYRTDVTFGISERLEFNKIYGADTAIETKPGTGEADFIVTPDSEGEEQLDDTGYSIEKRAEKEGKTGILYTVAAGLKATESAAVYAASTGSDAAWAIGTYAAGNPSVERQRAAVRRGKAKRRAQEAKATASDYGDEEYEYYGEEEEEDGDFPGDPDEPDYFNGPGVYGVSSGTPSDGSYSLRSGTFGSGRAGSGSDGEEDRDLSGKVITDQIPEALVITKVTVSLNGGEEREVYTNVAAASGSNCEVFDRLLKYTVPPTDGEDGGGNPVETVVLRIHTQLSDDAYNAYLASGAEYEKSFPNRAYLKGQDNKTLALSERVEPEIRLGVPFSKDGKPLDPSNKSFRWTLNINSEFSNPARITLYAVDHLTDIENTHNYRIGPGGELGGLDLWTGEAGIGAPDSHMNIFDGGELSGDDAKDCAYENVKGVSVIREILNNRLPNPVPVENAGDAIMYTYEVTREGKTQKDAVLLIPLKDYADREIKVTYVTDAVIPDYSTPGIRDEYEKELKNDAKLLWIWGDGSGEGDSEEYGSADLTKTYAVRYSLVKKTAYAPTDPDKKTGYDKKDNTVTWYFEVNQLAVDGINSLEITDELPDGELRLLAPEGAAGSELILHPIVDGRRSNGEIYKERAMGAGERPVPYWDGAAPEPVGDYYRITPDSLNDEGERVTAFKLHLAGQNSAPALRADEHYYFTLKTQVVKLDAQGNSNVLTIRNAAQVTADVSGNPVNFETSADCQVDNTLIVKKSIPVQKDASDKIYYDYTNHTVKWRVTLNPGNLDLRGVALTDKLPVGTSLASWTGAGYGEAVDTEPGKEPAADPNGGGVWTAVLTPPGGDSNSSVAIVRMSEENILQGDPGYDAQAKAGYSQKRLVFTFLNGDGKDESTGGGPVILDRPITVEFTTTVDEAYRKAEFSSNQREPNYKLTLRNRAILTANQGATGVAFTASDTAKNELTPQPIVKSGEYKPGQKVIVYGGEKEVTAVDWILLVNRTCSDIGGATLTDQMQNCMELLPETMKVEAVKLKADGSIDETIAPVTLYDGSPDPGSGIQNREFKFRAPNAGEDEAAAKPMDWTGFSCTVPAGVPVKDGAENTDPWNGKEIAGTALRFTYTSVMVEDAYASEITNSVSLKGGDWEDGTDDVRANNSRDFYTESYATAKGVYFAKIYKTSVNKDTSGRYPLDQTDFKIEKLVTPKDGAGSADLAEWKEIDTEPGARNKTRTTNRRGSVTFLFLRAGAMYKITETKAHPGYVTPKKEWYVVIKDESPGQGTPIEYPASGEYPGDGGLMRHLLIHDAGQGKPHYKTLDISNQVDETINDKAAVKIVKKGQKGQLLAGVEFTLSRRNLSVKSETSGDDGIVEFNGIDQNKGGNDWYKITETAPAGYKPTKPLFFQRLLVEDAVHPGQYTAKVEFLDHQSFEPLNQPNEGIAGVLTNEPITGSGSFEKVNQNKERITEPQITFRVSRRGDGGEALRSADGYNPADPMLVIDVDGGNPSLNGQSNKTYYPYLPNREVTTWDDENKKGVISFKDYPYGDYKFEEVIPGGGSLHLLPGATASVIYIHIGDDGVFATPVIDENTGKPKLDADGAKQITDKDGKTVDSRHPYQTVNRQQYGFVQIKKVAAEKNGAQTEVLRKEDGSPLTLAGAKFNIYRDVDRDGVYNSGTDSPVVQNLTTDEDGRFVIKGASGEGTYDDAYDNKSGLQLTVGKYLLREETAPAGFEFGTADEGGARAYPFEIEPWGNRLSPQTVYVGEKPLPASEDQERLLYNIPLRKQVSLTKTDQDVDGKALSGAAFEVYVKVSGAEKLVAYLIGDNSGAPGKYVLSNKKDLNSQEVNEKNAQGIPYLCETSASVGAFDLLKGTYYLKETKVPEHYQEPGEDFRFELRIDENGAKVTGAGTKDGDKVQNKIIRHDVKIKKMIETVKAQGDRSSSAHDGYALGKGFEFTLNGTAQNGKKIENQKAVTAGKDSSIAREGEAIFKNIPVGTYTLSETDVPAGLKHTVAGAEKWAVGKMPDIRVEVTDGGVSYSIAGTGGNSSQIGNSLNKEPEPGTQDKQDSGLGVYKNGQEDALLAGYNNYYFGAAEGIKWGILPDGAPNQNGTMTNLPLSGAEFELTGKAVGGTGAQPEAGTLTATSDANGKIRFTEVPFGSYTLTETRALAGYARMEPIEVYIYDEDTPAVLQTAGRDDGKLLNETLTKSVKFRKVDQNGDPLEQSRVKTTFKVERTAKPAGAGIPPMPDFTEKTVTNDENGVVTVDGLACGTYRVTEIKADPEKAVVSGSFKTFYIKVEQGREETAGSSGTTKVTLSSGENMAAADAVTMEKADYVADQAQGGKMTLNRAAFDFSDLTKPLLYYAVENTLAHGMVNVQKTAADNTLDGNGVRLKPTGTLLEGVVFKIYEDKGTIGEKDGSDQPVLTAVTGEDGRFKVDSDGNYLNEDGDPQEYRLAYKKPYLLHEESLPGDLKDRYMADRGYYPFMIEDEVLEKDDKTVYIGTGEETVKPNAPGDPDGIKSAAGPAGGKFKFPNGPLVRGTLELVKTDPEKPGVGQTAKAVSGAQFDLYVNDGSGAGGAAKAGMLRDNGDGIYKLRPGTAADGYTPVNGSGQEYVQLQADGTYLLLCGSYYIKETKAPAGYMTPEDSAARYWYFTVDSAHKAITNADLTEDPAGAPARKEFTNALWKRSVTVEKQVEEFVKDTFRAPEAADGTFNFRLHGRTAYAAQSASEDYDQTKKVAVTGAGAGKAVFTDVPSGIYTLEEIMTGTLADGRDMAAVYVQPEPITVTVNENGVFYRRSGESENGAAASSVTVRNRLKRGSVAGEKTTRNESGVLSLAGAVLTIRRLDADGKATEEVRTAVSKQDGSFVLENLPLGRYELTELTAPNGYLKEDRTYTVTVDTEGARVTTDGSGEALQFMNEASGTLAIVKTMEVMETTDLSGVQKAGEGFEFCIRGTSLDQEDITELYDASGAVSRLRVLGAAKVEEKDGGPEGRGLYVVTGGSGQVTVSGLPVGDYEVVEVENGKNSAGGLYVRDTKVKNAAVEIDPQTKKVSEPVITVENRLKRSDIRGLKTTGKGAPLSGAVIGLFPAGAVEYTEANLYRGQKALTGEDGVFQFTGIPLGEYQIRELVAPNGYRLNTDTVFKVRVTEDGGVITRGEGPGGEADIQIANTKRDSGGHGDNGGGDKPGPKPNPESPAGPAKPTEPETQLGETQPGEIQPENPIPVVPVEPDPDNNGGSVITTPPDIPPNTGVIIEDPDGDEVYRGRTDENRQVHVTLPPGDYTLITIDENEVPLGQMLFTIEDGDVPLGRMAPDAGDHSIPIAMLAVIFLAAVSGLVAVCRKRRELEQDGSDSDGNDR